MRSTTLFAPLLGAAATLSPALAQDECNVATAVLAGTFGWETLTATQSPELWNCAGGGAPDTWRSFTAGPNDIAVTIDLCGGTTTRPSRSTAVPAAA